MPSSILDDTLSFFHFVQVFFIYVGFKKKYACGIFGYLNRKFSGFFYFRLSFDVSTLVEKTWSGASYIYFHFRSLEIR